MPYATMQQADEYHNARLSKEAWQALPDDQAKGALQSASDAMDLYAQSQGGWRQDYRNAPPEALVRACCEEALALCDQTAQARIRAQAQGVTSISIGSASESYAGLMQGREMVNETARALLRPYLRQAGGAVSIL